MMMRRRVRPHPLYRVPLFHVPRPPRPRRARYVEGSDFDEYRDELRRDRDNAFEEPCR
jgi:hypothetical protein